MSDIIYIAYSFQVEPLQPATEILIAELSYVGFESFIETDKGVTAYILKSDWNPDILNEIQILNSDEFCISYIQEEIEQTNWNQEWEKNFNPIHVDDLCTVRAPFHEKPNTLYDIVIEPKMSFGTGHHETTHMMIQHVLNNDLKNKSILDMGCGTGVLAILSEKKGARHIDAIDIDNWCYLNTLENVERNRCNNITVYEGDSSLLKGKKYDIILGNINRNILLKDLRTYAGCLNTDGMLIISGFYQEDIPILLDECKKYMLKLDKKIERNNWVSLKFLY